MTTIQLQNIAKTVAGQPLFTTEHLTATTGDRVGIVGANGAGKTTLAKIIAGQLTEFTGSCQVAGTVLYVP